MSKLLATAQAIGAQFAVITHHDKSVRFYKRGSWDLSRNCLLYWNFNRERWDNSSELNFKNIEYGFTITGRKYDLIDFEKSERKSG